MTKKPIRLLVLDDEPKIRQLIRLYFEEYEEFDITLANSAEEALAALEEKPVDICIVDIRLPGMTGQDFIHLAQARGSSPRFMIHTGSVEMSELALHMGLGVTRRDIFLKPADIEAMLRRVLELSKELEAHEDPHY
ncbi:MAG: response regulator [Desulfovibrionaceae bacterium]